MGSRAGGGAGGRRSRHLAIRSARASPPVRGFTGRSRRVPRSRRPVSSESRGFAARRMENKIRSESNIFRQFRAAKPRANGRCVAGCEATRHCKAASPAHTASAPHPASLRRLRAPRAPTPAAPRRSPLLGGPGRRSFAGAPRGGASARPPTRDGGRTRRGPRASGVATAGGCGAGCGASARRAGWRRRGNEPPDGPHRAASAPAARPRPKAKAALPRGPRRGRPTARLRSRSEAEPSERDREAGSRGRKNRSRIRGESERAPRGGWDRDDDEAEAGVTPRGRGGARDRRHAVCASDPGFGNSFSGADAAVRRRSAGACAPRFLTGYYGR